MTKSVNNHILLSEFTTEDLKLEIERREDKSNKKYKCDRRRECGQYREHGYRVTTQCEGCGSLQIVGVKE